MKSKLGENISYNVVTDKVQYDSFRTRYPLPSDYVEVEYLQMGQKDAIVINDMYLQQSQPFGLICKFLAKPGNCFMGAGRSQSSSSYSYGLSLWNYTSSSPILRLWGGSSDGGQGVNLLITAVNGSNQYTPPANKPLIFDISKPTNGKQTLWVKDPDNPLKYIIQFKKSTGLGFNSGLYGPWAFFNEVMYDATYPDYYGWPITYKPTSEAHNVSSHVYCAGLNSRLYSNIVFYNSDNGQLQKYIYTCYKKSTHQYGLYDVLSNTFYGAFRETLVLNYWNDTNYYWNNILTASGNTRYAKEKTFINICGPDE